MESTTTAMIVVVEINPGNEVVVQVQTTEGTAHPRPTTTPPSTIITGDTSLPGIKEQLVAVLRGVVTVESIITVTSTGAVGMVFHNTSDAGVTKITIIITTTTIQTTTIVTRVRKTMNLEGGCALTTVMITAGEITPITTETLITITGECTIVIILIAMTEETVGGDIIGEPITGRAISME